MFLDYALTVIVLFVILLMSTQGRRNDLIRKQQVDNLSYSLDDNPPTTLITKGCTDSIVNSFTNDIVFDPGLSFLRTGNSVH